MEDRGQITADQYERLLAPLNTTRVAQRKMSGQNLSYLESWDVRAHLIRIFGFGNFDITVDRERLIGTHEYKGREDKPMVEVIWQVTVTVAVRDDMGREIARYTEVAVGSATGGREGAGLGDLHDNAAKSATSDALKRCCINLGTQFGLSLYNHGVTHDVVKGTVVKPQGWQKAGPADPDSEAQRVLADKLGAEPVTPTGEGGNEGAIEPPVAPEERASWPEEAKQ